MDIDNRHPVKARRRGWLYQPAMTWDVLERSLFMIVTDDDALAIADAAPLAETFRDGSPIEGFDEGIDAQRIDEAGIEEAGIEERGFSEPETLYYPGTQRDPND